MDFYTEPGVDAKLAAYALLTDAVPLSNATPLADNQNGFAGTAEAATRPDHRHPLPLIPPTFLRSVAGEWATPHPEGTTTALAIGRVEWMPYFLAKPNNAPLVIDRLGVNVTTAGSADASLRLGFYANGANDRPTTLLASATIPAGSLNSTGGKEIALTSYTFPSSPWFGWVAMLPLGTSAPVLKAASRTVLPQIIEGPGIPHRAGFRLDSQAALPSPATGFSAYINDPIGIVYVRAA